MDVSVVIPVKNGMPYIEQCLEALLEQDFTGNWEICVYDDASTDCTVTCVEGFIPRLRSRGVDLRLSHGLESGGVGFAKNRAVEMSCGRFICFCDADDISEPSRIQEQFAVADSQESPLVFVGSNFRRFPENSTERYSKWANDLSNEQLTLQVYTSHGPTLIAPTWFISRELFTKLGGFKDDVRTGFAEDLEFFYRALDLGHVSFCKANKILVKYRYHPGCSSFGVSEDTIWNMRIDRFRRCVLPRWPKFTIWNAGKQGKRFFKSLSEEDKRRVECFCDVDEKKIKRGWFEDYDEAARVVRWKLPIVHVKIPCEKSVTNAGAADIDRILSAPSCDDRGVSTTPSPEDSFRIKITEIILRAARPPLVICVKLDMTGGDLERLVAESEWTEGRDYIHFS
ncbi:hypothetical protein Y032_0045g1122 [Ancylostoma ceylanicum]|uniref:Glycosyltransferase 2-like domain-containing protein n=1 Tax=Ancylostoma ceylanicum TaxID=53326 RepID=A0A016UCF7_9BILA|nr:hypothetical protein Y032_0045g1122 [Ancylostoma ceylanicum]